MINNTISLPDAPLAPVWGLPKDLRIPIAAKSLEAIEAFAGSISKKTRRYRGRVGAVLVQAPNRSVQGKAKLWSHPESDRFRRQLFPPQQVWIHIDYTRYRQAYIGFGLPPIPEGYFLDHIQNRKAIRLRDYSHPYVRLCPVSRTVNTNAGGKTGAEGIERTHLASAKDGNTAAIEAIAKGMLPEIIYADPSDLTKMLNIPTGTQTLDGVRDMLPWFYG